MAENDKRAELLETDQYYKDHIDTWRFLEAAYTGAKSLIEYGILGDRFEKPEQYSVNGAAYGFDLSPNINSILTNFIAGSGFIENYGETLPNDKMFKMFMSDCDGIGTNYKTWFNNIREVVGYLGHVGVIVDMAQGGNPAELESKGIYPFVHSYSPMNILQMKIEINPETNRPYFSRIKLHEHSPERVIIWEPELVEVWELPEDTDAEPILVNAENTTNGFMINGVSAIPFQLWINDRKPGEKWETVSNIRSTADYDSAIIVNGICLSSLLINAGFPTMVIPEEIDNPNIPEKTVKKGVNNIQTETVDTKNISRWIAPEVAGAIQPTMDVIKMLNDRAYFAANLAMILASDSKQPRSGESQEQAFKFLEGKLIKTADNELESRRSIIKFWLAWENKSELFDEVSIEHDYEFNVKALIAEINDMLTEKSILANSPTAQKEIDKILVRKGTLKDLPMETMETIDDEIDSADLSVPEEPDLSGKVSPDMV